MASVAAMALAAPAAASARAFKCPADGGPKWRELTTAHFVLRGNVDGDDLRDLALRLERTRAALLKGISRGAIDPPGRIEVVVPRADMFEEVVGDARVRAAGWFRPEPFQPQLVVAGTLEETTVPVHELTHYLLAYNFARLPLWLNEGLATYFEHVSLDVKKNGPTTALVGRPPDNLMLLPRKDMLAARQARVPVVAKARALFAWGAEPVGYDLERLDLYATAWASTHYLVNRQPQRFSQLLARYARGEAPAEAWRAVFPEFDPATDSGAEAFEKALEDYVQGSEYTYMRFEVSPDLTIASERELGDAEVHVVWGSLLRSAPTVDGKAPDGIKAERWKTHAAESLRKAPDNSAALWLLGARERARDAVAASPQDWRSWMLLAESLGDGDAAWPERSAAYEKAAQLAPDNAGVLNEYAWTLLERGDSIPALPIAVRAARASPWSAAVIDTLGAVLADLGRCREAVPVQQRAVELLQQDGGEGGASIRKRLESIQAQCRATKM